MSNWIRLLWKVSQLFRSPKWFPSKMTMTPTYDFTVSSPLLTHHISCITHKQISVSEHFHLMKQSEALLKGFIYCKNSFSEIASLIISQIDTKLRILDQVPISLNWFSDPGLKGPQGAFCNLIVCPSVSLSIYNPFVRNSVPLTYKVQYVRFW